MNCFSPAWLFAPVWLTRFQGSKPPPCFAKAIRYKRCPPFLDRVRRSGVPRCQRYYEGTTTGGGENGLAYGFTSPFQSWVGRFAPIPCRHRCRPGPAFKARRRRANRDWSFTVPPRFLGSPSPTFAPLFDPGRSALISPWRSARCCPHSGKYEDTHGLFISELYHAALVSAVYASRRALPHPMQDSLPAGG